MKSSQSSASSSSVKRGLRPLPAVIFASRWLQVPLYLGLVAVLVMLSVKFVLELVHLSAEIWTMGESKVVLAVLTLVDITAAKELENRLRNASNG